MLAWRQAQVDRAGNLWILREKGTAVVRLDRDGRAAEAVRTRALRAFDADSEWGIVALDPQGEELRWFPPGSAVPVVHALPAAAAHVAWLDGARAAVSTLSARDEVATVDVASGRVTSALIRADSEIQPQVGATLLRSLVLAPDLGSQRLFVLDSLTGHSRTVSFSGRPLATARLAAHRLPDILDWLQQVDREAKKQGEVQAPFYLVMRAALAPSGYPWVVEHCDESRRRATVAVVTGGEIERREFDLPGPYCSLNFALWGDEILFAPPRSEVAWRCAAPRKGDPR